jgi:hypothetical protein
MTRCDQTRLIGLISRVRTPGSGAIGPTTPRVMASVTPLAAARGFWSGAVRPMAIDGAGASLPAPGQHEVDLDGQVVGPDVGAHGTPHDPYVAGCEHVVDRDSRRR